MPKPTKEQKLYFDWVASKGCCVPYCGAPASIHHQIHERCDPNIEIRQSKNHWQVTPLCKFHHQDQQRGWHGVGSNWLFKELYGIDLVDIAQKLFDEYESIK